MNNQTKFFGTDGIRGKVGGNQINPEFVIKLGWAVGRVLTEKYGKSRVLVGKDTRISGYMLESALEAGLSAAGVDISLLGPMPTPAISYLTTTFRAQAGIVISASHNLFHDNGIKFFTSAGRKLSHEVELAIEKELDEPLLTVESDELGKASRIIDAAGRYVEFCKSTVPTKFSLKKMKIVLDCANGATYHVAPDVFNELGAELIVMSNEPDGFNINENCGATSPALLAKRVMEEKADFGLALDGDGDRVILVDEQGKLLDGDDILYIIAKYYKKNGNLFGGVVGTVMSNLGLEQKFNEMDVEFSRAGVGDKLVIEELEKRKWSLGGEPSGHIVNLNFNETGDGIISALKVLEAMVAEQQSLSIIKKGFNKYPHIIRNVEVDNPREIIGSKKLQAHISELNKQLQDSGRLLVRASGTESLIRVMVEGENPTLIEQVATSLVSIIQDLSK